MKSTAGLWAVLAFALSIGAPAKADDMTLDEIRQGYKVNAILAQYYRWYQIYERPEGGIQNALDVLTPDVVIQSSLGTANGHDEYATRVQQLPNTWQNAHFVNSTDVRFANDGTATLTANITYLNTGMVADTVRTAELNYTITYAPGDDLLPLASSVTIAPKSDGTALEWRDAYADNRAKSLIHYYLAIIEDPARDPEPMRALFADDFRLNFSSGAITDFEEFKEWLAGPASQVAASTHVIRNFEVNAASDTAFDVSMDFDWAGLLPDGTELVAKTRHNWTMTNDVTERFARIKTVDVEILEPFRPKEE